MSVHGLKTLITVTILLCAFELLSALGDDDSSEEKREEAGRQIREFMPEVKLLILYKDKHYYDII